MAPPLWLAFGCFLFIGVHGLASPVVVDARRNITYHGTRRNGIEAFLGIPYGLDTGGPNRFRPPRPHVPRVGDRIMATSHGAACPQQLGGWLIPISLSNVTSISEDCLTLNVARPRGTCHQDRLPVMVYIHGGSFWTGQSQEITIQPDGLVLESVQNGLPVIHVAMNYRLGLFGFAQSDALRAERSENAALRDQRLAMEWVRDNIAPFGGNPDSVTIFGQSSGGLAVGMHIVAYAGRKRAPFHRAICQSQALEPGITANFTSSAMRAVIEHVGCRSNDVHAKETMACLRDLDMQTLLNASLATYRGDISHNIGDIWLPVVDGDFLPAAPSRLVREAQFSHVTTMLGWCEDDVTFFTDIKIRTAEDTARFLAAYLQGVNEPSLRRLLSLYPVSDFPRVEAGALSSEFYRSARIFRDVLMVCPSIWFGERMAAAGNDVYLYDWNQTMLEPLLAAVHNQSGLGPIHTSEFAYIFGNLSHYDLNGYPFRPTMADHQLRDRGSRSWSTFASTGMPGSKGRDTFQAFAQAYPATGDAFLFVAGGPHEGRWALDDHQSPLAVTRQKLRERCAFINSPAMIEQLAY
ncbi:hypothetical protein RJ55_05600 [Drechmeria coniospora]|nr:hypothetical protein RJ55_05600 [Drechmeria coniospora]